ncbi:hypothetical protein KSS87_006676 [Heliosperma pusillum]|nr:hypothetical protein KSS87_006676 [Heliosperma pusillum]
MEALYAKLYEKYCELKSEKENQIDEINREQEIKFVDFVSAAEKYTENLTAVNKRLSENINQLRVEVVSVREAKVQQFHEFQECLMEEKKKNQLLALEVERLRNLQHERTVSNNGSDRHEEQHVNSNCRSSTVSRGEIDESSMRLTRKRARLFKESDPVTSSPAVSHVHLTGRRELSTALSKSDISKTECCQIVTVNGGPCKCMFQGLLEHLIGMKVSAAARPEGQCLNAVHPSSGYSFSLTWVNDPALSEVELLYNPTSLGTFSTVAPEWMKEAIKFSINMCPIFFERLSRFIKHQ